MKIKLQKSTENIDWKAVAAIFSQVGWGDRLLEEIAQAFTRSSYVRFAFCADELVGVGRTLDDGRYYALIVDASMDETLESGATIFVGSPKWSISMATLQYVLIIHEVENYESWKKVFDQAASIRKAAGERSYQVLSHENDPNQVVHFSSCTSSDDAKQFFESPELIQIRLEAGVKSPEFSYLNQLESDIL
jgi:hypothetical protein